MNEIKKALIIHVIFFISIIVLFFLAKLFVEYFNIDEQWIAPIAIIYYFLAFGMIGVADYFRYGDKSSLNPMVGAIVLIGTVLFIGWS